MEFIYLAMTEEGAIAGAFLDEKLAELKCIEANREHQPHFSPYFVNDVEVLAAPSEWMKHCPACKARAAFYSPSKSPREEA
jgi:hypothetical protein